MAGGGLAVVYSSDCPAGLQRVVPDATFVYACDGTADDVVINAAETAVMATGQSSSSKPSGGGGAVQLVGYNFSIKNKINHQSWVDLGGAFGKAACQLHTESDFADTAVIAAAQTYTELSYLHDFTIYGSNGAASENAIYFKGQSVQTPYTHNDPQNGVYRVSVYNPGGACLYFDASCRACTVYDVRTHGGTYGLYSQGLDDSQITLFKSLSAQQDGIYAAGDDTVWTNCGSWNAGEYGWQVASGWPRQSFVGCHAEDPAKHGWFINTSKILLTGCTSDSAGLGNAGLYDGFNIVSGDSFVTMKACQSYDRNATPHQRYGVYLNGTLTNSRIDCCTYGNATGSFGGTTTPGSGSSYDVYGT